MTNRIIPLAALIAVGVTAALQPEALETNDLVHVEFQGTWMGGNSQYKAGEFPKDLPANRRMERVGYVFLKDEDTLGIAARRWKVGDEWVYLDVYYVPLSSITSLTELGPVTELKSVSVDMNGDGQVDSSDLFTYLGLFREAGGKVPEVALKG